MNATLGHCGVLLGLAASIVGAVVIATGLARKRPETLRSGQIYAALILLGAVVATVAMQRALITHDFSIAFVAENNSRSTPLLYTITGMWSALSGSILLWGLVLAGYIAAMVWRFRRRAADPLVGWATLVTYVVAAFFFALMAGPADPFQTVTGPVPATGLGPNVLLQDNPLVAFHPPLLYLGLVGFTIPFAFAVASLVTGRIGEGWQVATRRWTLVAWGFLTVGVLLGAWWSYQVLGWGGFWGWDPVENAAVLPWLCATAYLHSVMVQERRGLLRVWNLSLVISTFSLTILGTFLTRSGVITSVHAFSDSDIGGLLLGFFGVVVVTGVGLIAWRGDRLRSPGGIDSPLSREGAFLLNNLLFVLLAVIVLLGTVFPLLYEALEHQQVTVGAPYFDALALPIGLCLLVLMAIGPALPWRKATVGTLRDRLLVPAAVGVLVAVVSVVAGVRGIGAVLAFCLGGFAAASNVRQLVLAARGAHRHGIGAWRGFVGRANGGMVVHIGVVVIAVALAAATSLGHRGEVTLRPGQTTTIEGQTITFEKLVTVSTPVRTATEALVVVDGHGPYRPAVSQYGANTEPVGTPAIDSNVWHDVYLTIDNLPAATNGPVGIGVTVQPLVSWLWVGGAILVLGSVLAALPGRRRRPTDPVSAPVPAVAEGNGHAATSPSPSPAPPAVSVAMGDVEDGRADERVRRIAVTPGAASEAAAPPATAPDPDPAPSVGRQGRHTARWIAGGALVVMAALVALLATRPPATATEVYTPLLGKPAPGITGTTVSGQSFDLATYRGRWVFVNFFASWCPPCQQEEPELVTFAYQHRAPGDAALVGVVYDDATSSARSFAASSGATWPAVVDPGGQIESRYGLRGPPETFLISPTGIVVDHIDGPVTATYLDQQLAKARAAQS